MADENKKVEYQFTGDVSSLEKATKRAISSLGKYESVIKDLAKSGKFEVGKTAFSSFDKTINNITKQVNSFVGALNKASAETQKALAPDTTRILSASTQIAVAFRTLQESSKVTSEQLKNLDGYLKGVEKTFTSAASKASILNTNFREIQSLNIPKTNTEKTVSDMEKVSTASTNAANATKQSVDTMSSAYRELIKNAPFINHAKEVEASYDRVAKSAKESAKVMVGADIVKFEGTLERIRTKSQQVADGIRGAFGKLSNLFSPLNSSAQKVASNMEAFKAKAADALNRTKLMAEAAGSGFRQLKAEMDATAASNKAIKASADASKAASDSIKASTDEAAKALAKVAVEASAKANQVAESAVQAAAKAGTEVAKKVAEAAQAAAAEATEAANRAAESAKLTESEIAESSQRGVDSAKGIFGRLADYISNNVVKSVADLSAKLSVVMPPQAAIAVATFIKSLQTLTNALGTVAKVMTTVAKGAVSLARNIDNQLKSAVQSLISKFKSSESVLSKFQSKIKDTQSDIKKLATFISGLKLGSVFGEAVKSSMAYIENLNLFSVAMGKAYEEANEFVNKMAELYGMDPSNLYRYAGYFNQLTDAIGMSTEASKRISLSLTKAANDMASLFNVEIEQVVNNLASGMQGMSMAVRKYGIDIRQATLAQTALNYGFTENISTTSEANRQALRYLTIMQQVKNATRQVTTSTDGASTVMGDFARNIETPANQLRILKEQVSQVARAFGNFLIPVMQKTLYVINGVLMAIKLLLQFFASLLGIDISGFGGAISAGASAADDAAASVGGIGDAAAKSAKKLKDLVAPFDELNILSQPEPESGSSGGGGGGIGGDGGLDPGLAAAIESMSLGLDEVRMKALDVRDKILEVLGLEYDGSEISVTLDGFIDNLINLWDAADYTGFGARIAQFFNDGIQYGVENTNPELYRPQIEEKITILTDILNSIIANLSWEGIGEILGNGITIGLTGVNTFLENFSWPGVGEAIANTLNGVIETLDWALLGDTIGNDITSQLQLASSFATTFNWEGLGEGLGTSLNSALGKINEFATSYQWDEIGASISAGVNSLNDYVDWELLGQTLGNSLTGAINGLNGFIENVNWYGIGSNIGTSVNTLNDYIDWDLLGETAGNALQGALDALKGFVRKVKWKDIGSNIGDSVNSLNDSIDWDDFGETVGETIQGKLDALNSFVDRVKWRDIGTNLGTGINTIITTVQWDDLGYLLGSKINALNDIVDGIFDSIDFNILGNRLGRGVQTALDTVDWGGLGNNFGSRINDLTETIRSFWDTYEWGTLGKDLATFLNETIDEVNWSNLGDAFSDTLRGLLTEVISFCETLDWAGLGKSIADFITGIDWWGLLVDVVHAVIDILGGVLIALGSLIVNLFINVGTDIIGGLLKGITDALVNIATWIDNNIIIPIVNAVKNLFGIHSPSTVFADIGGFLIGGLLEGIYNALITVGTWIKNNIIDPIVNNLKGFFGIVGDGASSVFDTIGSSLMGGLKEGVTNSINAVVTTFSGLWTQIQNVFSHVTDWFRDTFSAAWQAVKDVFSTGGKVFSGITEGILKGLGIVINTLIRGINTIVSKPFNALNTALSTIRNVKILDFQPFKGLPSIPVPQIPELALATGGVVTGPTRALIGEGKYDEAVIPLGNSPQMEEMLSKFADKVEQMGGNSSKPVEVRVYIGDKEWDAFTYKSAERGKKLVGAQPIREEY